MVLTLAENTKAYFASDLHLGVPNLVGSLEREKAFVAWLQTIRNDCGALFLLGDVFDFWFEHKHTVPKGYTRLLGAIASICDAGIPVYYFTGNHDMWTFGYLEQELGVKVYSSPQVFEINGKRFFLAHGDGLGPGDKGYKFIKKLFAGRFTRWLFARLHPNLSFGMARFFSRKSRMANRPEEEKYMGDDQEFLVQFIRQQQSIEKHDFYIFGHRHLPIDMQVESAHYINLGEWVNYRTYAVLDGENLVLNSWK